VSTLLLLLELDGYCVLKPAHTVLFPFFRIKKGEAEIGIKPRALGESAEDDQQHGLSGLVIKPRSGGNEDETVESTQAVLAFTMKDWKRLCAENFAEGEEGGLPHRTGSKIRNNASQES